MVERELNEGVKLSVINTDRFKSPVFMITYIIGLTKENASFASLLPGVLKSGSAKLPTMRDISIRREELYSGALGASVTKRGEVLFFTIYTSFLERRYLPDGEDLFSGMLGLINEVYYNPLVTDGSFETRYVETEKRNLIDTMRNIINNKGRYAYQRCNAIMCEGEPYAIPSYGYEEDVAAITGNTLYDFYRSMLANAPVRITYTGELGIDKVEEYVKDCLPCFSARCDSVPRTDGSDTNRPYAQVIEEIPAAQGKLTVGMRTNIANNDPDYCAFVLFNELYGAAPSGKLFTVIREKLSLCYYCSSSGDGNKGVMFVSSGIDNANFERTRDGILEQLDEIRKGNISDDELTAAKKSLANTYKSCYDSASDLADWYLFRSAAGLTGSPDDVSSQINALTKDDVVRVSKRIRPQTVYFLKGIGGETDDTDEN